MGRPAETGGRDRFGRLRSGRPAARRPGAPGDRRRTRRRQSGEHQARRHGDGHALRSRPGLHVGPPARAAARRSRRRPGQGEGLQCRARRGGEPDPGPARRAHLRVFFRGSVGHGPDGGVGDRRSAEQSHHFDDQALRPRRPGDGSRRARRPDRSAPRRASRIFWLSRSTSNEAILAPSCAPTIRSTEFIPARTTGS